MGVINLCREYTDPRDEPKIEPKCVIGDNTKIEPIHDNLATTQYGRFGIEVKIGSLTKNDGSISWAVISRGVGRYVTELSMVCTELRYVERITLTMGRPVPHINSHAQSASINMEIRTFPLWTECLHDVSRS